MDEIQLKKILALPPPKAVGTAVTTPPFRISYPHVFKPTLNKLSQRMEYCLEALFPLGSNLGEMKKAAEAAIVKKWTEDRTKWPQMTKNPFRDQKEKTKEGKLPPGLAVGAIFMKFAAGADKHRPAVVDQQLQAIVEESKFYAGGWAKASVNAFAYAKGANIGVSFGLNSLQFFMDDEPFSGRPSIEDSFTPIEGTEDGKAAGDAGSLF